MSYKPGCRPHFPTTTLPCMGLGWGRFFKKKTKNKNKKKTKEMSKEHPGNALPTAPDAISGLRALGQGPTLAERALAEPMKSGLLELHVPREQDGE